MRRKGAVREEPDATPAELEERLDLLKGVSIFFTLPAADLRRLARKLRPQSVERGTQILKQGEIANRVYLIVSGRCEVRAEWTPGHSVTVGLLGKGDFVGVSAIKSEVAQLASVTALEYSDLLELDRADIDAVVTIGSTARAELERLVAQRREMIAQVVNRAETFATNRNGMITSIYSVKGGSGKTTIGVNLAAALGHRHPGDCVVLDLSLPFNDAALVANLIPNGCLALTEKLGLDFEEALLGAILYHPTGMMVLPSAVRVAQSELVTPELVRKSMGVLQRMFGHVIVDLGVAVSEVNLTILERSDRILVVVTPELPALKDTKEALDIFQSVLRIPAGNVTVILNHPRPGDMVSREDVERMIGREIQLELDHDGFRCDRAGVTGEILMTSAPGSPISKKLRQLAVSIDDEYRGRAVAT